jgi:anti-sigma28 factor (negative regulator of flagellin synthesis)
MQASDFGPHRCCLGRYDLAGNTIDPVASLALQVADLESALPSPRRLAATVTGRGRDQNMYVYGTNQIHTAQPLNPPHRMTPTAAAGAPRSFAGVDQLDISPEADFVAQTRDLPEIREDRVAALKAQIQSGTYETANRLDVAVSRLLDEIA